MISSKQVQALTTSVGYNRELARINNFMPEGTEGDNAKKLRILSAGDPIELKKEGLLRFVYQVSNNLIEDQDEALGEEGDGSQDFDEMGVRTIRIFRGFCLPLSVWKEFISQTSKQPTGKAFLENLFEAAANTQSVDICETLLELGANPNRLIMTDSCHIQRPIQLAVEYWVDNEEFLQLLIRFGADVNLVSGGEDPCPALFKAAKEHTLQSVRALVDAGANLWASIEHDEVTYTALAAAVESDWRHSHESDDEEDEPEGSCCRRGVEILNYLLPNYDIEEDHEMIQSALVMAATRGRKDLATILLDAGADANEASAQGYTPLICAVHQSYKAHMVPMAQLLLENGADPNMGTYEYRGIDMGPIHIAAFKGGEEKMLALLLGYGADIDAPAYSATNTEVSQSWDSEDDYSDSEWHGKRKGGMTALQVALMRSTSIYTTKSSSSALLLLRAGANLTGGEFASAAAFNSIEAMQELVRRGADINDLDSSGRNALEVCIEHQHVSLVEYLIQIGTSMDRPSLIKSACRGGNRQIVKLLVDHGIPLQCVGNEESLLIAAAESKNWELMSWLMSLQDLSYSSRALCLAVTSGIGTDQSNEIHLATLLRNRPRNKVGDILEGTALAYAAFWNQHWVTGRLLKFRHAGDCILPLVEEIGYYTLMEGPYELKRSYETKNLFWDDTYAIRCSIILPFILASNWPSVRRLMDAGYRPDRLSLLVATKSHPLLEIQHLTSHMHVLDISKRSREKLETPLQAAVRSRRRDVVEHFLDLGVDVNALPTSLALGYDDEDRIIPARTALQHAVALRDLSMIDLLLDAGADVNAPAAKFDGATALQIAAATGQIGLARRLIALGADIDAPGSKYGGRMALEAAAERGRLDMVQFLLECGVCSGQYETAMDIALGHGYMATVETIREWMQSEGTQQGGVSKNEGI
ncbi:unnamed protein product [Clonostachys rosea]|uniref:Uncharacterized protein n=1 Tax=Bionectria ochroleuca TaxID=29856 RepID=A0ABY6UFD5_BIOOC|nr:unnamed protein product [Clonostachys rosea]